MPDKTLTIPALLPAQQQVVDEAARFNVLACGRRWGKTTLGADRVIETALEGKPAGWFAPSYKLLQPTWRELQARLKPILTDSSEQEKRLVIQGGGSVECWSLDNPDAGRGRAYRLMVVDECATVPNLERCWSETLRPMLSDHSGSAWFLSTPKGVDYFCQLFNAGQDPDKPAWKSWRMPTDRNPRIQASEIEAARQDLSELAFSQEYLAQFVSWSGAVFRNILGCVADPPLEPAAIISVDWARTSDYTVFLALSYSGAVLALDRFRNVEYALQIERLRAFWEKWGEPFIVAESNNMGGPLNEALQRAGLPVISVPTTHASKAAIIDTLALAFERGEIRILSHPALIAELQSFEASPLPSGLMKYGAPAGLNDDCVMSLAIGYGALDAQRQYRAQPAQRLYLNLDGRGLTEVPQWKTISRY